jgi:ADP-ribose pyrophosphatase YjhB (NUDIX family)
VVDTRGALLLVTETGEHKHGRWSLPAGKVEPGESMVTAVAREVLEETGVRVEATGVAGIYHSTATSEQTYGVTVVFRTKVLSGEPSPSSEHPTAKFVDRTEIDSMLTDGVFRSTELMQLVLMDLDADRSMPLSLIRTLGVA